MAWSMNRYVLSLGRGAIAGTGGTVAMTAFMEGARAFGAMDELPARKIMAHTFDALGIKPSKRVLGVAALAAHFGIGAAVGAGIALLRELGASKPGVLPAAKLATGVWALAYQGVLPALGLMPHPKKDRSERPTAILAAHWIYGATFDAIEKRMKHAA